MDPSYQELSQQAIDFLKPYLAAAGGQIVAEGIAAAREQASKVFQWLKVKFTGKAVATAMLEQAQSNPSDEDNWLDLRSQIERLIERDDAVRRELATLMAASATAKVNVTQTLRQSGDGNAGAQVHGDNNTINVGPR